MVQSSWSISTTLTTLRQEFSIIFTKPMEANHFHQSLQGQKPKLKPEQTQSVSHTSKRKNNKIESVWMITSWSDYTIKTHYNDSLKWLKVESSKYLKERENMCLMISNLLECFG